MIRPEIIAETIADPRWFPLRLNAQTDEFHFALITPEVHRELAFLRYVTPPPDGTRVFARSAASAVGIKSGPLHLILHSGWGGSTLLARGLSQAGVALSLQEPPILTDAIAYGLKAPSRAKELLSDVTQLLSRPFGRGEAVVCKMSIVGNGLAAAMASANPATRLLCLQTPLDEMLSSFASRGLEGRSAARKLFVGIRNSRMHAVELTEKELNELSDLQLAALGWLSVQKIMLEAAARFGPERVRSLVTGQLLNDTSNSFAAAAKHFGLRLNVAQRLNDGLLKRHAKTGEPFDSRRREERIAQRMQVYGQEIAAVVNWARKLADATGIAWNLPDPLIGQ